MFYEAVGLVNCVETLKLTVDVKIVTLEILKLVSHLVMCHIMSYTYGT